ncbi:MAG: class I SAM-dependent methyltransferase [Bacteroidota bacterium]
MEKPRSLRWRLAQWLEIRWWQQYLRPQDKFDYYDKKRQYWYKVLQTLAFSVPTEQQILEVGCGPAGIFTILNECEVLALDPLITEYITKLPHFSPEDYPWVKFQNITLEEAQLTPRPLVFCFNAINHIANWERGLDQLTAHTQAGGTLILGIDVHNHSWLKYVFRWLPGDALHPQQHDRNDYLKAMQQRGWKVKKEQILKKGLIFDFWTVVLQLDTVA